jgi:hypothetical protein
MNERHAPITMLDDSSTRSPRDQVRKAGRHVAALALAASNASRESANQPTDRVNADLILALSVITDSNANLRFPRNRSAIAETKQ